MAMDGQRLRLDFRSRVDEGVVAASIIADMQTAGEGAAGAGLMQALVARVLDAVAEALGPAVVSEVQQATLTVTAGGLQSYVPPAGGIAPTTAPVPPVPMSGVLS